VAPAREARHYTLIYDGDCRVCNRSVNILRKLDVRQQLEIVPSQTTGVGARFPWIPAAAFTEAIQLIGPDGETWQGAAAVEQLLGILPRGRWFAWMYRMPFVRTIADKFYRWFARNRYRFGCTDHCVR
jgi:predicted DCC family thiol-disulfide oxidoreductase YuxK